MDSERRLQDELVPARKDPTRETNALTYWSPPKIQKRPTVEMHQKKKIPCWVHHERIVAINYC
jgi:hypothetical protein